MSSRRVGPCGPQRAARRHATGSRRASWARGTAQSAERPARVLTRVPKTRRGGKERRAATQGRDSRERHERAETTVSVIHRECLEEIFDDIFQCPSFEFPRCVDLDEVANGKVGKILWRVVRAAVQLKSTTEFLQKEAGNSRYAPGLFLQIAADAAEAGDERLELCAKRAFEHDAMTSS